MIPDELRRTHRMTGNERLGQNRDSEYMGAEDIDPGTEPVLTIAALYFGTITLSKGREEKEVIVFKESTVPGIKTVRPLVVNASARKVLKKLYNSTTADVLEGKRVKLYVIPEGARNPSTGEKVDCIRIRPEIPKEPAKTRPEPGSPVLCADCKMPLRPFGNMGVTQLAEYTAKQYGRTLCADCASKVRAAKAVADANGGETDGEKEA